MNVDNIPHYRVRLFLTVDLVGSTAYKAASKIDELKENELHPDWVQRFKQFYRQFPEILNSKYSALSGSLDGKLLAPQVWKTVGDEILFCCRVYSIQHLSCCVHAFLLALEEFGRQLETDKVPLDVKGAGWVAAFPTENISIAVFNGSSGFQSLDLPTEEFEREADDNPHRFDFLGSGIDTGFRISKNAAADRFTASVGLAYLLCEGAAQNFFTGKFEYHGREPFKGVNRDQPYPVVSIVSERDEYKRTLRERERLVRREDSASPVALRDFLRDFMAYYRIDEPRLPRIADGPEEAPLQSYERYQKVWIKNYADNEQQDSSLAASIEKDGSKDIPDSVVVFAEGAAEVPEIPAGDTASAGQPRPSATWPIRPGRYVRRSLHPPMPPRPPSAPDETDK